MSKSLARMPFLSLYLGGEYEEPYFVIANVFGVNGS